MKQGSILLYLQPRATVISEDVRTTTITARLRGFEDVQDNTSTARESCERQIESNIEKPPLVDTSDAQTTQPTRLSDPRAAITKVFPSHMDRLKSITTTLLPVRYSDRFFAECLESDNVSVISYVSLFDSKPVGWIRCRLEPFPSAENPAYNQLYIQALGILAPYRGKGFASALLDAVMSIGTDARSIYAHVWETNEDALEWYAKHGFAQVILIPQYYRRLRPSGAWLVRKEIEWNIS